MSKLLIGFAMQFEVALEVVEQDIGVSFVRKLFISICLQPDLKGVQLKF